MSVFLTILGIAVGCVFFGVYIYACVKVCEGAKRKGHTASPVACFFFGVPYMISVWSKPDLKARPDYSGPFEPDDFTDTLKPISVSPKAVGIAAAALIVIAGGVILSGKISEQKEQKKIETMTAEFQAEIDSKKDSVQGEYCRKADIGTLTYTVSELTEDPNSSNSYIATVKIDCVTKNKISSVEESLVAYELEDAVPYYYNCSDGSNISLYNSISDSEGYGSFMIYSTVNGNLVHYPGYLNDESTYDSGYGDYSYFDYDFDDYDYDDYDFDDYDFDYNYDFGSSSTSSKYSTSSSSYYNSNNNGYETWVGYQFYNKVTGKYTDMTDDTYAVMLDSELMLYGFSENGEISNGTYTEDPDGTITLYDTDDKLYGIAVRVSGSNNVVFGFADDPELKRAIVFRISDDF